MHDPFADLRAVLGSPLDRRRFLKGSAAGMAILGFGAGLPAGCTRYPRPVETLRFLNAKEYAIVNQAAERILGVAGQIGGGEDQIDVAARVDPWLAAWDLDGQQQLRIMLRVFEHGTSLFDLQRKRFTRLSDAEKDCYLAGWMRSTLGARRVAFRALKALAAAGYYSDPRAWDALHYDGPWLGRVSAEGVLDHEAAAPLSAMSAAWQAGEPRR
jgi:hypothetical protein